MTRQPVSGKPGPTDPVAEAAEVRLGLLNNYIGFHLRLAQDASFHAFSKRVGRLDLKPGHFTALLLIGQNPGITPTAISRMSGRHKSTLTPALRSLEKRNLVKRQQVEADRRSCTLTLTEAGERMLAELMNHAEDHDRNLDRIVGKEAKAQFVRILRRIALELY